MQRALASGSAHDEVKDQAVSIARATFAPERVAHQLMQVLQEAVDERQPAPQASRSPAGPRGA